MTYVTSSWVDSRVVSRSVFVRVEQHGKAGRMRIYRVSFQIDDFVDMEIKVAAKERAKLEAEFSSDNKLKGLEAIKLSWAKQGKDRKKSDISEVAQLECLAVTASALDLFDSFSRECCELVPAKIGRDEAALVHVFSIDAFPSDHRHTPWMGDFITSVNDIALTRPLFRERLRCEDGSLAPGIFLYATDTFKNTYDAVDVPGLEFEVFWPLEERIEFIMDCRSP